MNKKGTMPFSTVHSRYGYTIQCTLRKAKWLGHYTLHFVYFGAKVPLYLFCAHQLNPHTNYTFF